MMALEPVVVSAQQEANPELLDVTRRFWMSAALSLPLLLIAMGEMLPLTRGRFSPALVAWIQCALATPVVLWGGGQHLRTRLGFGSHPPSEHVYADPGPELARPTDTARWRRWRPESFPLPFGSKDACPFTLKPRRRSPRSSCSGRFWNCARAANLRGHSRTAFARASFGARSARKRSGRGRPA